MHLLFVMLRVFQVSENDVCLWSKELKNYEVSCNMDFNIYQVACNCMQYPDSPMTVISGGVLNHSNVFYLQSSLYI